MKYLAAICFCLVLFGASIWFEAWRTEQIALIAHVSFWKAFWVFR